MIDDYLINGKLYLKTQIIIKCSKTDGLIYDSAAAVGYFPMEWITIHKPMDVIHCDENELIFEQDGQKWAYSCITSLFLETSCLSKAEIRDNTITDILDENL